MPKYFWQALFIENPIWMSFLVLHLVHDQLGPELQHFQFQDLADFPLHALDALDQVVGRADAHRVLLVHGRVDQVLDVLVGHDPFEAAVEGALDEPVGVLDGGGLGQHHQDAVVREEEEVEDVEGGAGAEVQQDVVRVEGLQVAEQPGLLREIGLAASRKSWAPLIRLRFGMLVLMITSWMFSTRRFRKSDRVISGTPMPSVVWRLAPPRSASTRRTFFLSRARVMPILPVIRLLPIPPLPPPMAQISFLRRASWSSIIP